MEVVKELVLDEKDLWSVTQWMKHLADDRTNEGAIVERMNDSITALCRRAYLKGVESA